MAPIQSILLQQETGLPSLVFSRTGPLQFSLTRLLSNPFFILHEEYFSALFFLIALVLLCSRPMMFLNDEWITGNQIYQIDQGHQILFAEGKYGYYGNNTPG